MVLNSLFRHRQSVAIVTIAVFFADLIGFRLAYAGPVRNNAGHYMSYIDRNTYLPVKRVNNSYFDFNDSKVRKVKSEGITKIEQASIKEETQKKDKEDIGGPGQPEMQAFSSVGANNLVNLFTGDFSYNIPLLDVGGYPLGLSYSAGATMDQEAGWVGLGWNINPGTIMRNVRGLPDEFNGNDSITKQQNTRPKWTAGITVDFDPEIFSKVLKKGAASLGIYYDNYTGPGYTASVVTPGIDAGKFSKGDKTYGTGEVSLGISFDSKSGFNVNPTYSAQLQNGDSKYLYGTAKIGLSYNSRAGLQDLQITGSRRKLIDEAKKNSEKGSASIGNPLFSSTISFTSPTFTPSITMPTTTLSFTFRAKTGAEFLGLNPLAGLGGNYNRSFIAAKDRTQRLPAYGYLHLTKSMSDQKALMDFNREKDIPYRNSTPNIAVPLQTYDVFSISGEGIGGSFRAYRGDAGVLRDHRVKSKSTSANLGVDFGVGNLVNFGADIRLTMANTENRPWSGGSNIIGNNLIFKSPDSTYESVYFRNPGEQSSNTTTYYNSIGDDDLVRVKLTGNRSDAVASNNLARFDKNGNQSNLQLTKPVTKINRDKRNQVISYLSAAEASIAGLEKEIYSYKLNVFPLGACDSSAYIKIPRIDGTVRKSHHISEMTVLNPDGRSYVYGIPAYNLSEEEATFSVNHSVAQTSTGLVSYSANDMSENNSQGKDGYFNKQTTPSYAHSFLLTGLKSSDYVDVTGNGITDDDLGDAVKFNYSRMQWNNNDSAFKWRTPTAEWKASYDEGLRTDNSDDKGHVVYGKKEVWYLNSIESKTMIAAFTLDTAAANLRKDAFEVKDINGGRSTNTARKLMRLKEINLYSKADLKKYGTSARPVKTVNFSYSYRLCKGYPDLQDTATGKLTLEAVWFTYNKNQKGSKNKYIFNYGVNPVYQHKAYDRWGNYKPSADNPGGMLSDEYPYANKDSIIAAQRAAAWNLSEITLPSGAKMKVQYESDDYGYVQNKRANEMFQIAGFGSSSGGSYNDNLYTALGPDHRFVYIKVTSKVSSKKDVFDKYLRDQQKLLFRLHIKMPSNGYGSGNEYIPVYADYKDYGLVNDSLIWVELQDSPEGNNKSPLATAAIQFLRLNLPSKAYEGSDVGNEPAFKAAIMTVLSVAGEIKRLMLGGFNSDARISSKSKEAMVSHSFVRLSSPEFKKLGGGHRVKKITIHDNWQKMVNKKESVYGQEYRYTTAKNISGKNQIISSGVASYEPSLGNEENPFHQPVEYKEKATLAPSNFLYVEEPFAESLFPSAGVGYSKVRVSSINRKNIKSASGFEETEFYTAFDFPTLTQRTYFDDESQKKFITKFSPFSIRTRKFITLSQGFKIELNDMHGKTKSTSVFTETDSTQPITYTAQYYRTEKISGESFRLVNTVPVIDSANGKINMQGQVGKDIELVTDMREQYSVVNAPGLNVDMSKFIVPFPFIPFLVIPSMSGEYRQEKSRYRAVSMLKIVQRYGILDSVVHIDKGSKVSTRNKVWDGETGEVLLTETQNEFNDLVYQFQYPAHWAYKGAGLAYKNIDAVFKGVNISGGKVRKVNGSTANKEIITRICESGDEVLVTNTATSDANECMPSSFDRPNPISDAKRLWVVDRAKVIGGAKDLYFIDRNGSEYSGHNVNLRIIRSGRRNVAGSPLGSIVSLKSPIKTISGVQQIVIDSTIDVVTAGSAVMKDVWPVEDRLYKDTATYISRDADGCDITTWSYGGSSPSLDSGRVKFSHLFSNGYVHFPDSLYSYVPGGGDWEDSMKVKQGNLQFPRIICNLNNDFSWEARVKHNVFGGGNPGIHFYFKLYPEGVTEDPLIYYIYLKQNSAGGIWKPEENLDPAYSSSLLQVDFTDWKTVKIKFKDNKIKVYIDNDFKYERSYTGFIAQAGYFTIIPHHSDVTIDNEKFFNGTGQTILSEEFDNACTSFSTLNTQYDCKDDCLSVFTKKINPYVEGIWGNWRGWRSYVYYDNRKETDPSQLTNIRKDGVISKFTPFWTLSSNGMTATGNPNKWVWNSEVTRYNRKGLETENHDPLNRFNSGLYGYNNTLPVAVTQNARHRETAVEAFEDYSYATDNCADCPTQRHFDFSKYKDSITTTQKHSGKASLRIGAGDSVVVSSVVKPGVDSLVPTLSFTSSPQTGGCVFFQKIQTTTGVIYPGFTPLPGKLMVLGAWVKEDKDCKCLSYTGNSIDLIFYQGGNPIDTVSKYPAGNIIEGWQRYEDTVRIPSTADAMVIKLRNNTTVPVYFDDLRIFPHNSNMKSFVYHPTNLRLLAELDENNYASFYEYDDEGTLIRVKKETERGVKTISETRSALRKTDE